MNLTRDRARSVGWALLLSICFALTITLTFRVNAVKSEVRLTERQIVALKRETIYLETEFRTRSNQQQLKSLNDVEFGYAAPVVGQYIEGERQLAALGKPRGPDAPAPIRVAIAETGSEVSGLTAMVSPLTGKAIAAEMPAGGLKAPTNPDGLRDRLSRIARREAADE